MRFKRLQRMKRQVLAFTDKKPMLAFFILLGLFLCLIVAGNFIRNAGQKEQVAVTEPKIVSSFGIGQNPKIQLTAKVDKTGVIDVVAQTPGIVQSVFVTEGMQINRGQQIVSLSTNYQGGVIPSVTRQIAQKNYEFVESTIQQQKDMITLQRDLANKNNDMAGALRNIMDQAHGATSELIALNEENLTALNSSIAYLESTNVGGVNDAAIFEAKTGKAGILSGLSALKSGLRNAEYQAADDKEPAQLATLSRDLVNKQLDLQEKSLDLNRELAKLNLTVAQIGESLMYPVSPVTGTVEHVHVHAGEQVNPGTILATISGTTGTVRLVVSISSVVAQNISRLEPSTVRIGERSIELTPLYVSREPTDGSLHAAIFVLPAEFAQSVSNRAFITIEIPVRSEKSSAAIPFVPLDVVYQTENSAYVFIASPSAQGVLTATSREITLGTVVGSFVEVRSGITSGDQIIVNRNVVAGDAVTIQ